MWVARTRHRLRLLAVARPDLKEPRSAPALRGLSFWTGSMNSAFWYRTSVQRSITWFILVGITLAIYGLYRWSEPTRVAPGTASHGSPRVGIHLENVPFAAYSGGHKAWSLWAKGIDLEHSPYSSATSIQSATLTDIRNGVLYASSDTDAMLPVTMGTTPPTAGATGNQHSQPAGKPDHTIDPTGPLGPPAVKFHAHSGRYFIGASERLPGDLSATFTAKWQLRLEGDVTVVTRDGDSLHAESLTIMQIVNQHTNRVEQRMQCDTGATVTRRDVKISANWLRYTLRDHTVELLDGVRAAFKAGNVQSERCFWMMSDDMVRIPDAATGTLDGNKFRANGLVLDMKHGQYTVSSGKILFQQESDGIPVISKH